MYLSMALLEWKELIGPDGDLIPRMTLRVNPSSGKRHPTEAWLFDAGGAHHYCPDVHGNTPSKKEETCQLSETLYHLITN